MSAKDRINSSDSLYRSGRGSGMWNACVAMKRRIEKSQAERMKSAATKALLCLVLGTLLLVIASPVAADTDIDVEVDHKEADTWSSIVVIINLPLLEGVNNTTYHLDRKICVTIKDLDTPEVLISDVNVSLISGIATYNFRILPEWGEFLLAVDVFDPYTAANDRKFIQVKYSVDYVIYLLSLEHDEDIKEMKQDNANTHAMMRNTWILMALTLYGILPVALLRLDHKSARQQGKSSMWDKAQDKWFNFSWVNTGLWHYLEDGDYGFRATGRRPFHERKLGYALGAVQVDMMALRNVESELKSEIRELKTDEFDEPDSSAKAMAASVARAIEREMNEEVAVEVQPESEVEEEEQDDNT